MANGLISPAAPIFWAFHAFLDDVYEDFQTCTVPVENRNIAFINSELLSDHLHTPSGEVNENLFKEWSDWSKNHLANLV